MFANILNAKQDLGGKNASNTARIVWIPTCLLFLKINGFAFLMQFCMQAICGQSTVSEFSSIIKIKNNYLNKYILNIINGGLNTLYVSR